jgi:hypothetical protein
LACFGSDNLTIWHDYWAGPFVRGCAEWAPTESEIGERAEGGGRGVNAGSLAAAGMLLAAASGDKNGRASKEKRKQIEFQVICWPIVWRPF